MATNVTNRDTITVRDFYDSFKDTLNLEILSGKKGMDKVILEPSVNRPALAITGYFKNFSADRIQLFGAVEMAYLRDLPADKQAEVFEEVCDNGIPCCVIARGLAPIKCMSTICEKKGIVLMRTRMRSKDFSAQTAILLGRKFSPKTTIHGTLIDIKGIGVLIRGISGIGKSECALALIERGHSLVADDITYCELYNNVVYGKSNDLNRGYMECRGIGIIDIAKLFGVRYVRVDSPISLVVTFQEWKQGMLEERTGLETNYFELLSTKIHHIEIPVRPGRDMARLVEVAAMVKALKNIGHDCAKEFNDKLIKHMQEQNKK